MRNLKLTDYKAHNARLTSFILTMRNLKAAFVEIMGITKEFYINYEEFKGNKKTVMERVFLGFILTMRNLKLH